MNKDDVTNYAVLCNSLYTRTGCGKVRDPTAQKNIIVPVVLNSPAKCSGTVSGIVCRLQY